MELSALQSALAKLDVTNGNHWTADGQPRLDTVKMFSGNPGVNREMIEAEAPGFTRATAAGYTGWQGAASAAAAPAIPATEPPAPPAPVTADGGAADATQGGDDTFSDAQPAEQPEVAGGTDDAEDEVEALEAQLAEAIADTEAKRAAVDDLTKQLNAAIKLEDKLRDKLVKVAPPVNQMTTLQAYVARQHTLSMERALQRDAIVGSGVNLQELGKVLRKGSPLDQAMARKTGRGGQRPMIGKV